jgi:hypothetical protein
LDREIFWGAWESDYKVSGGTVTLQRSSVPAASMLQPRVPAYLSVYQPGNSSISLEGKTCGGLEVEASGLNSSTPVLIRIESDSADPAQSLEVGPVWCY